MKTTITDYIRVIDRAAALGCLVPDGIAILPDNFETAVQRQDFLVRAEAATVRKLLRQNGLPLTELLPPGERATSIHNKSFDWAPLLFVSAALLTENPAAVSIALGIISNYATEFFRGMPRKEVSLDIVVETKADRTCKKLSYQGDVAGLDSLPEIIRRIGDG